MEGLYEGGVAYMWSHASIKEKVGLSGGHIGRERQYAFIKRVQNPFEEIFVLVSSSTWTKHSQVYAP